MKAQPDQQWILGNSLQAEEAYGMATDGEELLLAVTENIDSIGGTDTGIGRINNNGQLVGRTILGSVKDDFVRGFVAHQDGGYLLTGIQTAYSPFRQHATLTRLSSSLDVIWQWLHTDSLGHELNTVFAGQAGIDYGNALAAIDDSYWLAGFSNIGTDSQVLLAGQVFPSSATSISSETTSSILMGSNPVISGTTVSIQVSGDLNPHRLKIFDVTGKRNPDSSSVSGS